MGAPASEHSEGVIPTAEELNLIKRLRDNRYGHLDEKPKPVAPYLTSNPTCLGISVFAVANQMIALHLFNVRGIEHLNLMVGILWFTGGCASWLTAVFEFMQGNTFAYCVFGSFGGYYFSFAATLTPAFGIADGYASPAEYNQSLGIFFAIWGSLFIIYFITSLRTNFLFAWIFAGLIGTAFCLAASYWVAGDGNADASLRLAKAGGAFLFASSFGGWYLLLSQLMTSVGYPFQLPLGNFVKPAPVSISESPSEV